jgi:hypothetical protein
MIPNFIILDTKHSLSALCTTFNNARIIPTTEMKLILLLCDLLVFEKDAEAELSNECISETIEHPYDLDVNDKKLMMYATMQLGRNILEELQRFKAYEDGILPFGYFRLLGLDIVMERKKYDAETIQKLRGSYSQIYNHWTR